ncbi:LacI family DNA-binding transcriptional regulator [Microlunatus ginsengisoli]|uniref:LacI family DNA-binding transcriptional regulator n=1 Tax=Microlunatus ginsengisoli TaxID=363863 RepID=UPI0031E08665
MSTDEPRARAANIFDVARLAGVSHQTVSRVLNDHPSVRPATRQRVEEAIRQLRYRPSSAARALVTRRSRNLGLIMPGSPDFGPSSTVLAFTTAARAAQYTVSISSVFEASPDSFRAAVESLLGQHVEAIVLVGDRRGMLDEANRIELDVPLVAVDASRRAGPYIISIDQYQGARLATEHLVALGHRSIVHLAGPPDSVDGSERERGWRDVLAEHRLVSAYPLVGDWSPDSGYRLVLQALANRDFTAIFSANDQMALGALHALTVAGVDVPREVSVIGFDDIPEAAHLTPPLTTIRQDFDELGHDLMAAVLDALDGRTPSIPPRLPQLVERESAGRAGPAPRSRAARTGVGSQT